jgi:hypothetical protein
LILLARLSSFLQTGYLSMVCPSHPFSSLISPGVVKDIQDWRRRTDEVKDWEREEEEEMR